MKARTILQPVTVVLTVLLLASVLCDTYTYPWNTNDNGQMSPYGGLAACIPWNLRGCAQLWVDMGTHHKIALILHVSTIPLIISLILIMTISAFTRVFRKRTAMIVLIIVSWLILFMLIASSILRVEKFEGPCLVPTRIAFSYHKNVYIVFTVASLILSLIVTQILAFAGYLRSKITVLSIDGDIHHCDRPVAEKLAGSSSMVTVRTLDAF